MNATVDRRRRQGANDVPDTNQRSAMTPEQIISELRFAADTGGVDPGMLREAADLIATLTRERDEAVASLDARWEHSEHATAKYYRKMREAQRELEARELHHFETEQLLVRAGIDPDAEATR